MEEIAGAIILKVGRQKPVRNRHPWIFSGAIDHVSGTPTAGDLVEVLDSGRDFLALAYFNPLSQIRARILTWDPEVKMDDAFWRAKLERAINARSLLALEPDTTAYRLVNAESDGIPGLVVDKYQDFLVVQHQTAGIDRRKEMLAAILADLTAPHGIFERADIAMRKTEGLAQESGLLWGELPSEELLISENKLQFGVNLLKGHKTGFYLDQRDNRRIVCQPRYVSGKEILNVFAYTGGFAVYAAAAGAGPITNIDSSSDALSQAETNVNLTGREGTADEYILGDAFEVLRYYRDHDRQFDVVILDPPKFAYSQRDVERASRGYKDLNWLAMRLLRPAGLLATFSCSGRIGADLFQKIVFGAAIDAARDVQVINHLAHSPDHPVLLSFPESAYLKGLLCRVL